MEIKDCYWPWYEAFIHTNGDVKPCCYAPTPVGNIYSDGGLASIWNGAVMTELREAVNENRLHRVCIGAPCVYVLGATGSNNPSHKEDIGERLRALADAGSGWGAARYATLLIGRGDVEAAEHYLRLGVERRNPEAAFQLAEMKLKNHSTNQGLPVEIEELLEQASRMNHVKAALQYASILIVNKRDDTSIAKGLSLLTDLVSRGDANAAFQMARYHEEGLLSNSSIAEAVRFYKLAATRRHKEAAAHVARLETTQQKFVEAP